MAFGRTSETDKIAKKIKARDATARRAAKRRAATAAAKKATAARAAAGISGAAQRTATGRAAQGMMSRLGPAAGLASIGAEIVTELRKEAKKRPARKARQAKVAETVTGMAPKNVREATTGESPTDMLRAASKGREVLATAQRAGSRYTVKPGDTLSEIAKAKGTTVRAIMKASGIKNANKIRVGQKIIIPDDVKRKGPYGDITKKELESGNYDTSKTSRFGKDFKKGGSISKPRGCGAAQRGYGKAMMCGGHMKGKK